MLQDVSPAFERLLQERRVLGRAAQLLASAAGFDAALRQTLSACLPPLGDFGFFDLGVSPQEVRRTVADAAATLADLLRVLGCEVRCAGDGAEAMALLDRDLPQLAVLDIGLPDEDGYALAARFDEHLVKPVALDRRPAVLQQLLG